MLRSYDSYSHLKWGTGRLKSLQDFQLCSKESMNLLTVMMLIILKGFKKVYVLTLVTL